VGDLIGFALLLAMIVAPAGLLAAGLGQLAIVIGSLWARVHAASAIAVTALVSLDLLLLTILFGSIVLDTLHREGMAIFGGLVFFGVDIVVVGLATVLGVMSWLMARARAGASLPVWGAALFGRLGLLGAVLNVGAFVVTLGLIVARLWGKL